MDQQFTDTEQNMENKVADASTDTSIAKTINGVKVYSHLEEIYKIYQQGNIVNASDLSVASKAKFYALFPSNLAMQTFATSLSKIKRNFYDLSLFSLKKKHS